LPLPDWLVSDLAWSVSLASLPCHYFPKLIRPDCPENYFVTSFTVQDRRVISSSFHTGASRAQGLGCGMCVCVLCVYVYVCVRVCECVCECMCVYECVCVYVGSLLGGHTDTNRQCDEIAL